MATHPTDDEVTSPALEEAQDMSIEAMGRLAEFWGFTRTMGRVYGALFLSTTPMTQQDITERLGVSAANVSAVISQCKANRLICVLGLPGDRRNEDIRAAVRPSGAPATEFCNAHTSRGGLSAGRNGSPRVRLADAFVGLAECARGPVPGGGTGPRSAPATARRRTRRPTVRPGPA